MSDEDNKVITLGALLNGSNFENLKDSIYYQKNLSLETPIYRYIRIGYFFDMLERNVFYIAPRSSFSDRYEKGWRRNPKFMFEMIPVGNLEQEEKALEYHRIRREELKQVYISSWTLDSHDYKGCSYEDFLMWKSRGEDTVRIKTTIKDLLSCIDFKELPVLLSSVKYEEDKQTRSIFEQVFQKTPEYINEQEIRLCIPHKVINNELVISNIWKLVRQITLSPFMQPLLATFLKRSLIDKWPELKDRIHKSHLVEY